MTTISLECIENTAIALNHHAAIYLPDDAKQALIDLHRRETNVISKLSAEMALKNLAVAEEQQLPMSGDTGLVRYFVKVGNEARIEGGINGLEYALRQATGKASSQIPLRANTVHPLTRENSGNNVGYRMPCLDVAFEPHMDAIEITVVQKGGIFGTDYRMLMPGDGTEGVRRFVLEVVCEFNRRGLVCGPVVVGIGLGGAKDQCMRLGKEAAVLRHIGDRHPDPEIGALEIELLSQINSVGFGIMGTFGDILATDVHIEVAHTAVNTLPVGIHHQDAAFRRASARIDATNRVERLVEPNWFTPYLRFGRIEDCTAQ